MVYIEHIKQFSSHLLIPVQPGHQLHEPTGFSAGLEQQLKYCDLIS